MFPSLNPSMNYTGLNAPYRLPLAASTPLLLSLGHRNPTMFLGGTRGEQFFSSRPHPHQLLDPLTNSSSGLDVEQAISARAALLPFPNPRINFYGNDGRDIRPAAAQNELLYQRHFKSSQHLEDSSISGTLANQPNQWSSSMGLGAGGGDTSVFSALSAGHRSHVKSQAPPASTSALSCAAQAAEFAVPLSKEEERLIPLVGGPESFPMVLHRILAELELLGGGRNIATFLPDGLSFYIKNQARFTKEVLPVFFPKMKSFASFQRQLNLYDFRRVGGAGQDRGAYRHELFVRDYPANSSLMRRTKIKGNRPRGPPKKSSKKEAEPNVVSDVNSSGEVSYEAAKINTDDDNDLEDGEKKMSVESVEKMEHERDGKGDITAIILIED